MRGHPRCRRCGLRLHRYAVGDYHHDPSAVACANSIIGLIEDTYDEDCTRPISTAITKLAVEIQELSRQSRTTVTKVVAGPPNTEHQAEP